MNPKAFIAFLGQFYDRILAILVLFLLVLCMGFLVMSVKDLRTRIRGEEEALPKGEAAKPSDFKDLVAAVALLHDPVSWSSNAEHRVFIAPLMKILDPNDPFPKRYNAQQAGEMLSSEGIPFRWLQQYHLSTSEPVATTDPDGDGFTVREEYDAGTDPTDPNSHPDIALKLRLVRVMQKSFPFLFTSVNEGSGGKQFSIRRTDGSGHEYFLKVGEKVPDKTYTGYVVVNFTPKQEERPSRTIKGYIEKVDVSELTIQREGEKPVVLVKNKPSAVSEDLNAQICLLTEDRTFEVALKTVFKLQDSEYQVVSIKALDGQPPEVVVKKEGTDKEFRLRPLMPEDLKKN